MSLDPVELILDLEREFDVALPDAELTNVRTVGHLVDLVIWERQRAGKTVLDRQAVLNRVRQIAADDCGEKFERVLESSLLVDDLGY